MLVIVFWSNFSSTVEVENFFFNKSFIVSLLLETSELIDSPFQKQRFMLLIYNLCCVYIKATYKHISEN